MLSRHGAILACPAGSGWDGSSESAAAVTSRPNEGEHVRRTATVLTIFLAMTAACMSPVDARSDSGGGGGGRPGGPPPDDGFGGRATWGARQRGCLALSPRQRIPSSPGHRLRPPT